MKFKWKDGRIIEVVYGNNVFKGKSGYLKMSGWGNINDKKAVEVFTNYDLRELTSIYGLLPEFVRKEMERIGRHNFDYYCPDNEWYRCTKGPFLNGSCYRLRPDYTDIPKIEINVKIDGKEASLSDVPVKIFFWDGEKWAKV